MLFEVPVVPDREYIEFLKRHSKSFHACHFSLDLNHFHDSRHRSGDPTHIGDVVALLKQLPIPRKYLLVNSRIQEPQHYLKDETLRRFVTVLEHLRREDVLDGLVVADFYFVRSLSDASRDVVHQLEAVPSVNCMIDSFDKLTAIHELLESTHFKPFQKINLDRSLNRNLEQLAATSQQCRARFPGVKLALLGNEGCIYQCPFKPAHDCIISIARMGAGLDTFRLHDELGCMRHFQRHPAKIFKSPFIRPEDVDFYSDWVDIVKLCGRTLGPDFLIKTVGAYLGRSFHGNLLEILDALEWAEPFLNIANQDLPVDFHRQLTSCSKDCSSCSYCQDLLADCSNKKTLHIRDASGE